MNNHESETDLPIGKNLDHSINEKTTSEKTSTELTLPKKVMEVNWKNKFFTEIHTYLKNLTNKIKLKDICLASYAIDNGLLKKSTKL